MTFEEAYAKLFKEADEPVNPEVVETGVKDNQTLPEPATNPAPAGNETDKKPGEVNKDVAKPEESNEFDNEEKLKSIRDELITTFNDESKEKTGISLDKYEPNDAFVKSFKVVYNVDKEEPYIDRDKYTKGEGNIKLNGVFYKDILSIAKKLGVDNIEWKVSDDGINFGTLKVNK